MRVYDKVEYRKMVEGLTGEYRKSFDKIEGYVRICFSGSSDEEETCMYQMLGEVTSAQKTYKPLSMVIGKNLREYCDGYINKNQDKRAKIIKGVNTFSMYFVLILLVMLVKSIRIYPGDFINNMNFGILEFIVLLYTITWAFLRVAIAKLIMSKNIWIRSLDLLLNVLFIVLVIPLLYFDNNILGFGVKVPFILFIALMVLLIAVFIYTLNIKKQKPTEN